MKIRLLYFFGILFLLLFQACAPINHGLLTLALLPPELLESPKGDAVKAFESDDYESAVIAVKKMGQSRHREWNTYNNALKTFKWLSSIQESAKELEKTKSQADFFSVKRHFRSYQKSFFASGDIQYKFPSGIIDVINEQKKEAVNIYNHSVQIENERLKQEAKEREESGKERERLRQEKIEQEKLLAEKREEARKESERLRQEKIKQDGLLAEKLRQQEAVRLKELELKRAKQTDLITKYVRSAGYDGFVSSSLLGFLYQTQRDSNLGDYLYNVIGSIDENRSENERENKRLKLSQQLQEESLYEYTDVSNGELIKISLFIKNEPNEINQEGQSLRNNYYAFTGMKTYVTVMGAERTLPVFKRVKILNEILEQ